MKRFFKYLLLPLIVLPAIWAIITPGYFPIHDNTQVVRVAQMTQALQDLHFPARWVSDLGFGFGYPIFNFYNPLPYYFGAAFSLLGLNALLATKLMFIFPVFLAAFTIYKLVNKYLGHLPGIIAAAFYTYAPYHAVQIYVRGSVAEYWAYAFIPLVILYFLEKKPISAGISLALLILSHNLSAIMIIPLLAIIFIIQSITTKKIIQTVKSYLLATALALGLSAFFWLPMIAEKGFTSVDAMVFDQFNPLEHFVYLRQLFSSPWGFASGPQDGLSFRLGYLHIAFSILALIFFKKIYKFKKARPLYLISLFILFTSLFLLHPTSSLIWSSVSALDFIQFPWRFLSYAALATSILAAFVFSKPQFNKPIPVYLFTAILIIVSFNLFQPQFKFGPDINSNYLLNPERIKLEVSARSDEYKPQNALTPQSLEEISQERFYVDLESEESVKIIKDKTHYLKLATNLQTSKSISFNIYAFPGWTLYIDDQKTDLITTDQKLLTAQLPTGSHQILLRLQNTLIRNIGNILSLLTLILLLYFKLQARFLRRL